MASDHGERYCDKATSWNTRVFSADNLISPKAKYEYIAIPTSKRVSLHIEFSLTCVRKGITANMIMMPDSRNGWVWKKGIPVLWHVRIKTWSQQQWQHAVCSGSMEFSIDKFYSLWLANGPGTAWTTSRASFSKQLGLHWHSNSFQFFWAVSQFQNCFRSVPSWCFHLRNFPCLKFLFQDTTHVMSIRWRMKISCATARAAWQNHSKFDQCIFSAVGNSQSSWKLRTGDIMPQIPVDARNSCTFTSSCETHWQEAEEHKVETWGVQKRMI